MNAYTVKLITFGDYFEVYKYTKPVIFEQEIKRTKQKPMKKTASSRSSFSLNRTRNTVRRLISANFTKNDLFVTLTFAENLHDVRIANTCFKEFIRYIRHYLVSQGDFVIDNFKYLGVIEFQQRGAVHYHVIMHAPFIPPEVLKIAWSYGFFKVNFTSHVENIGSYISKYLYKDADDVRLLGKRAYQTSRNLSRPLEIVEHDSVRKFLSNVRGVSNLQKKGTFDNEFSGRVYYRLHKRTGKD